MARNPYMGVGAGLVRFVRRVAAWALEALTVQEKPRETRRQRTRDRTVPPRDLAEPPVRHLPPAVPETMPVEPIEGAERHGAARDERSFEQRRRGGPVTGAGPPKARGPRHAGGGRRRGRDEVTATVLDALAELPIDDYDTLSVPEIEKRLEQLDPVSIARLRRYELANKHRKSVVSLMEKKLAA